MNKLLPLALTGCLSTNYEIEDEELQRCAPQVESLQRSCLEQNGTFGKAVDEARECFGNKVIVCSDLGPLEGQILYIGNYPRK